MRSSQPSGHLNIEVKARLRDPAAAARTALALSRSKPRVLLQEDTYYCVPRGRLKLRTLRTLRPSTPPRSELIYYERSDVPRLKQSRYVRIPLADGVLASRMLQDAIGIRGVVRKRRTLFLFGATRIHIDSVSGLGHFIEMEHVLGKGESAATGTQRIQTILRKMGVSPGDRLGASYIDLLEASTSGRHPRTPHDRRPTHETAPRLRKAAHNRFAPPHV